MFEDLLSEKSNRLWQNYLEGNEKRSRKESMGVLRRFLSAIRQAKPPNRREMARRICQQCVDEGVNLPVREPLFNDLLFPELLSLLKEGEKVAARYLASFHDFILKSEKLMAQLEASGMSQIELLKIAVEQDPDDHHSAEQLLSLWEQWFDYCVSEAPEVIRFKGAPATTSEQKTLLKELDNFENVMQQIKEEKRFDHALKSWRQYIESWQPL